MRFAGRHHKYGQPTVWKSVRIPEHDYAYLLKVCKAQGRKPPEALHALIGESMEGGDPVLRVIQVRLEKDQLEAALLRVIKSLKAELEICKKSNKHLTGQVAGLSRIVQHVHPRRVLDILALEATA